jgi:hypothetical protein
LRAAALLVLFILIGQVLLAHDPITTKLTWNREVSRLIHKRCANCHRQGGAAPMSLLTYEEARPWAKAIKEEVLERRMPPWGAVKGFGEFRDDMGLSQEELHVLADWVEGGAPEGDPVYAPYEPDFETAKPAAAPGGIEVKGSWTLPRAMTFAGIRPGAIPDETSVKAIALLPNGTVQPLLWLYNYHPKFERAYFFRDPVRMPRGTKVQLASESAVSVSLILLSGAPSPER